MEQIAALEKDQAAQPGLSFAAIGGKQVAGARKSTAQSTAALVEETPEEMIKNVEKMLQKEKQAAKATAKGGAKIVSFDLNEGMVGAVSG